MLAELCSTHTLIHCELMTKAAAGRHAEKEETRIEN